ncbi:MAG: hypothetical protein QM778_34850 [Myxococcales bacterium]
MVAPAVGLAGSVGALGVLSLVFLTYPGYPEHAGSILIASTVPAVTLVGSGVFFRLRRKHHRGAGRAIAALETQRTVLDARLRDTSREGRLAADRVEAAARVRLAEVDARRLELQREQHGYSYAGPMVLVATGTMAAATFALWSFTVWLREYAFSEYPEEYSDDSKRLVRGMAAGSLAGIALAAGGGLWFRSSRRARARLAPELQKLEVERNGLQMHIAPQLGPTSLGFMLQGRF